MDPVNRVEYRRLIYLLVALIVLAACTFINRFPTGDDAWFAEQSYWLNRDGIIRSEYFRGIVGWEKQLLVSHKLFLMFGSLLINWFGYTLPVPKLSGLIFFLVLIAGVLFYIYQRTNANKNRYLVAVAMLIFGNRLLVKMGFENRPEMMVAALGTCSFLLINFYRQHFYANLAAGFLAGLSFFTHLNGIIFVIAGLVCLWPGKFPVQRFAPFFIGSFAGCALYFIDIFRVENGLAFWFYQFRNDPATQASFGLASKLIQLVTFPRMFLQSPEQLALSVLLIYLIWHQRKYVRHIPVFLKNYSLVLVISFWLITKANAGMYLVLFIPFMLMLCYELYVLKPEFDKSFRWVLGLYFVIGIYGCGQLIYKNYRLGYLPDTYARVAQNLPQKETGVVPLTFFFNEYDNYQPMLTHENYKLFCHKQNMTPDGFGRWARARHARYILMDYYFNPESYFPATSDSLIDGYQRSFFDGRFAVFKPVQK